MSINQALDELKFVFKHKFKLNWDDMPQESKEENWDSFKDSLYRTNQITTHQYNTWRLSIINEH